MYNNSCSSFAILRSLRIKCILLMQLLPLLKSAWFTLKIGTGYLVFCLRVQLCVLTDVPVDVLQQCIIFLSLQYDNVDGELFRPIIGVDYEHELFFEHNWLVIDQKSNQTYWKSVSIYIWLFTLVKWLNNVNLPQMRLDEGAINFFVTVSITNHVI
jgi:hypothetical protein